MMNDNRISEKFDMLRFLKGQHMRNDTNLDNQTITNNKQNDCDLNNLLKFVNEQKSY